MRFYRCKTTKHILGLEQEPNAERYEEVLIQGELRKESHPRKALSYCGQRTCAESIRELSRENKEEVDKLKKERDEARCESEKRGKLLRECQGINIDSLGMRFRIAELKEFNEAKDKRIAGLETELSATKISSGEKTKLLREYESRIHGLEEALRTPKLVSEATQHEYEKRQQLLRRVLRVRDLLHRIVDFNSATDAAGDLEYWKKLELKSRELAQKALELLP